MLKNNKRTKRHTATRLGTVERLEERQLLAGDGFGAVSTSFDVDKYFPEYASPLAHMPYDMYSQNRVLNYAHYDGSMYESAAYHPNAPGRLLNEQESLGNSANNLPTNAESIPLGFDAGEDNAVDVFGELEPDATEPRSGSQQEEDGSILLANETELQRGEAITYSASIGDVTHAGGDFDFYAVRDLEVGDFLSVLAEGDGNLNPAVLIYDRLGTQVYFQDNTVVSAPGGVVVTSPNTEFVFEVPEDGDYFVMVIGAEPRGVLVPLNPFDPTSGLAPLTLGAYDLTMGINTIDIDYYEVDLNAGDIFAANVVGQVDDLQVLDPSGSNRINSRQSVASSFNRGTVNPLPEDGVASLAFVAPESGTYFVRAMSAGLQFGNFQGVNQGPGSYLLETRIFRPALEGQPKGNHQILFLDFDGQQINTSIWGEAAAGIATLSPIDTFLSGIGVSTSQKDEVIDATIAVVEENFRDIGFHGNNGDFERTGRHGDYKIEIRNSRDHADPFGQPNVSRVIIGGSIAELGIPTLGIAQSIDVGNFRTEETAVVLLDLLTGPAEILVDTDGDGTAETVFPNPDSINHYLTAQGKTTIDLFANAVGNITAHEAGHFFGAWHTDNSNEHLQIMDQGGNGIQDDVQAGVDRILGTQDDNNFDFGEDEYTPGERYRGGLEDTVNAFAFGLSTGTGRGGNSGNANAAARERMARGIVWRDANENGNLDIGERGLGGITIYADENSNKRFDIGEPAAKTDESGNYRITDINRERTQIRIALNPGLVPTSPADGSHLFVRGEELANKNFGVVTGQGTDEGFDYGNAPAPYPTSGVRHGVVPGLSLGAAIDGEAGPQSGDDADGVRFLNDVYPGGRSTIEVTVSNGDQPGALLQAWIDFDGDGSWSTPGEQVVSNVQMSEGVNTLSFNVPAWAINSPSVARFRYGYEPDLSFTGSSIAGEVEDYAINIEQSGPTAADDSYEFRRNSGEHRLAVLSNDSFRAGGLRIQSVSAASEGGSIRIDGGALVYEAAMNYSGTETFTYTVADVDGLTDSATVSVTTTADLATIRLVATDVDGNPITRSTVGSDFLLQAYVQDLRPNATGVHSAFLDVNYSSILATPTGAISYGDSYPNARSGNVDPGAFDEIGAIAALDRLDGTERLLFSVPMEASAAGTVNFIGSPADLSPAHDVLLFDVDQRIPADDIEYRPYSLTISDGTELSTSTNPANAMDVNDDNAVSPIDALLVINDLNGNAAARTAGSNHYLDVSGDGAISPIDALLVINYLNRPNPIAAAPATSDVAGALNASNGSTTAESSAIRETTEQQPGDTDIRESELEAATISESIFVQDAATQNRDAAIASILDELDDQEII